MYSPTLGRFISTDPIGFEAGDENLYLYVGNDPTNSVDPSGLQEREINPGRLLPGEPGTPGRDGTRTARGRDDTIRGSRPNLPPQLWDLPATPPTPVIGGIFRSPVIYAGFRTPAEQEDARASLYTAAERVHYAREVLLNRWDEVRARFEYTEIKTADGRVVRIRSNRFAELDRHRDLYIRRLNTVYNGLLTGQPRAGALLGPDFL